ncbi:MAG: TMEM175 family protein [Candidatus Eremiobacteraeota bacterium]|nr:TMEM175 family protein [Candidatus Eremiobacteraeota bacterium]
MKEIDKQKTSKIIEKDQFFTRGRITNLCDGVLAIVMTILVLDLKIDRIGNISSTSLMQEILKVLPRIETYIIVFILLGFFWLENHRIFEYIKKTDRTFIWLNIFFLMFISILPFFTDLVAEFEKFPIVVALFGVNLFFVQLSLFITWRYVTHNHRLIDKSVPQELITYRNINFLVALVIFFFSIPLAFVYHNLPFMLYLTVPIIICLLNWVKKKKLMSDQTVKTD